MYRSPSRSEYVFRNTFVEMKHEICDDNYDNTLNNFDI